MAETLLEFQTPVTAPDGSTYRARAVGAEVRGANWHGWIEFTPAGPGQPLCSPRETTQPNRTDVEYWATGLTYVYLEGALDRALPKPPKPAPPPMSPPAFASPGRPSVAVPAEDAVTSVLNPFSVYQKGEAMLRRQLGALSAWHLVNIILDYKLSDDSRALLSRVPASKLIDTIVNGVQRAVDQSASRRAAPSDPELRRR
jgi:hypothetical protein